ncbi:cytochrome P450 [Cyathus striatus]|nr:cytochrome P450 [Cyathus striatus]
MSSVLAFESYHFILFVLLSASTYAFWKHAKKALPLPPGPRKLPLIENLLDMPNDRVWLTFARWSKEYNSDIIHVGALGNNVIILNSMEAVNDLLEKRSSIYSSRKQLTMLHELMGYKFNFSFGSYDGLWRAQRKIVTQTISPSDPGRFHPQQLRATHELLRRLLTTSKDIIKDLEHWAAVLIMDVVYGIQGDEADPYIDTAIEALGSIAVAGTPGAFIVNTLPFLKYIPEWFPGAGFKRKAKRWYDLRVNMTEKPYEAAKKKIASGVYTPSLVSLALEGMDRSGDVVYQEEMIKGAAVTANGGGSDTVVSALLAFVLAVIFQPEIQTKAQAELDSVLGPGDLPTFNDQASLPYISAIVKEVLRHNPITPLAIPHYLTEDDTYRGYFIPKDSVVIGNAWAILNDEDTYPNPSAFNPDRFLDVNGKLNPDVMDSSAAAFGFGRRVCPGRHVAFASVWLAVASILATYNISKYVDEDGNVDEPTGEWVSGPTLFNHPLPFKSRFTPRSKAAEVSIRATTL